MNLNPDLNTMTPFLNATAYRSGGRGRLVIGLGVTHTLVIDPKLMPICVFYHGVFSFGNPREVSPVALGVVTEAMEKLQSSGLAYAADEIHCCFNGEERDIAEYLCPKKAQITMHGNNSFSENMTTEMMGEWSRSHPDWRVLYLHAKGASHSPGHPETEITRKWRNCMLGACVTNWQRCVESLDTYEAVGVHWLNNMGTDRSQSFFAGNFYWVRSNFLATLPSLYSRIRTNLSGIGSLESRYESEVFLSIGPRLPRIKDFATHNFRWCP